MKSWKSVIIIPFIFFGVITLHSQQLSCSEVQIADVICNFSTFDGLTGTMPSENSGGNQPNPLCPDGGAPHNIIWHGFVAADGDYQIHLTFQNCGGSTIGQEGVQVGMYTDCTFTEPIYCNPACSINPVLIDSDDLEPGQTYYLFIDGCANSVCDYTIEIIGSYENESQFSGTTFVDFNGDGIQNGLEPPLENVNISVAPGENMVLTNNYGRFSFNDLPEGTYTLTATISEGEWVETEISQEIIFTGGCDNIEIGFVPIPNEMPEAVVSITNSIARCGWETRFYITIQNTSFNSFETSFDFTFDDKTSFFSSDIPNIVIDGNTITGTVGVLSPYEVRDYIVTLKMPSGTATLPELDFEIAVFDDASNILAEYAYSDQLRCSYDPNDKKEYPDRIGPENLTLFEEDLEYKIRFQNNGNDTAFTVKIVDQLDPNIEPSSIRTVNSSHAVQTSVVGNVLEFLFEDINLVDSMTNYDDSQGFVTFRCNVKESIIENTVVTNQAEIIFDSNLPIITNSTLNTFVSKLCTDVVTEMDVEICEGDSFNGYTESGTYTDIIPIEMNCDSTVIINLEVQGITYSSQDIQACEGKSFLLNGEEYILYESQEISDTIYNIIGCISNVLMYQVDVTPTTQVSIVTTICEGMDYFGMDSTGTYTIVDLLDSGCDSITIVDLTVIEPVLSNQDFSVCEDESIVINGTEYNFSESSEFIDTIIDSNGCISTLTTIDVTVISTLTIDIDTTICEGMSYLGFSESGEYSFDSINSNGCFDIYSIQLTVLPLTNPACIVGIDEVSENNINIYPNPAINQFFIEGESVLDAISIYSMDYRKIEEVEVSNRGKIIEVSTQNLFSGLYIIEIKSGSKIYYKKLVIE